MAWKVNNMPDYFTSAILTAGLDRDQDGNLTDEAKATIEALKQIASDPDLTKELEAEIAQD